MQTRAVLTAALVFSGLSALIYQVLWTRMLGFVFGTTTEAIGTVLAIFFGGLALGNAIASRRLQRVARPLRLYAWLEAGIGIFALASLPLLQNLDAIYGLLGDAPSTAAVTVARILGAALVLLPPTVAMGATLPVVARGLVSDDRRVGEGSAVLYTANTLGAVLGAYLSGFWLIGWLGITRALVGAAAINLLVALIVLALRADAPPLREADEAPSHAQERAAESGHPQRAWFLLFFGISGFVAIAYEILWSKAFAIVLEGTIYSFSAVLAVFLAGIAMGSLAIARFVDEIRDLPRTFGLVHLAIPVTVAIGAKFIGDLPYFHRQLESFGGLHSMFLLVAAVVLIPTALFGAAFPLLVRIYTERAEQAGEGIGLATALNTAGSIAASLIISFLAIPALGSDTVLFVVLALQLAMAIAILTAFCEREPRRDRRTWAVAVLATFAVLTGFEGAGLDVAVAGRGIQAESLAVYQAENARRRDRTVVALEGKTSLVTVVRNENGWELRTNGMPESDMFYGPPYRSLEGFLLGTLPYLLSEDPRRALVVGFGGGGTVDALLETDTASVEVVELERSVVVAAEHMYQGRQSPLDDPRVALRVNDGRYLLLTTAARGGAGYGVIASQPSHPWLVGAANLFTQDYFELVRRNLAEGGVFALWVNGFHNDTEAMLAIIRSFERVFPGGTLVTGSRADPHTSLILLGGRKPLRWDLAQLERRFAEPALREAFTTQGIHSVTELLARIEGPTASFAALAPEASNTDDNAFVELRLAGYGSWAQSDFASLEERLPADAPVLPQVAGPIDVAAVARRMLETGAPRGTAKPYAKKLGRLMQTHAHLLAPSLAAVLTSEGALWTGGDPRPAIEQLEALADSSPADPEPHRVLGSYFARAREDFSRASTHFALAWERSGAARDAYDALRSTYALDSARAFEWIERIPANERSAFPRVAFYEAESALAAQAPRDVLEGHYRALLAYRATAEGREFPPLDATLGHIARSLGLELAARGLLDADSARRQRGAHAAFDKARRALSRRDLPTAERHVIEGRQLAPSDLGGIELAVRLATARGDTATVEALFRELRAWAPSLDIAVAAENKLRLELRLEPLPQLPADQLLVRK